MVAPSFVAGTPVQPVNWMGGPTGVAPVHVTGVERPLPPAATSLMKNVFAAKAQLCWPAVRVIVVAPKMVAAPNVTLGLTLPGMLPGPSVAIPLGKDL